MSGALNTGATVPPGRVQRDVTIDCFRQVMRELAGGVAVVTVGYGPGRTGFTSTSVESLSVEPPRLLLSVSESSSSWKELQKSPYFGVNILRANHLGIADQFAGRGGLQGEDRYRGANWIRLSNDGATILEDALAGADCVIEEMLPRHGHVIIIGRVEPFCFTVTGNRCFIGRAPTGKSSTTNQTTKSEKEFYESRSFAVHCTCDIRSED